MAALTIVTINRNNRGGLASTGRSVAEVAAGRAEWVLVDGASTDGSAEVVRELAPLAARVVAEPDRGIFDAFDKGLALATSEYIHFLNSADVLLAEGFDELLRALSGAGARDALLFAVHAHYGKFVPEPRRLGRHMSVPHPGAVLRTSLVRELGAFDTHYRIAGDYDLMLRYFAESRQAYVSETPLVAMEPGGLSVTHRFEALLESALARARRGAGSEDQILADLVRFAGRRTAEQVVQALQEAMGTNTKPRGPAGA